MNKNIWNTSDFLYPPDERRNFSAGLSTGEEAEPTDLGEVGIRINAEGVWHWGGDGPVLVTAGFAAGTFFILGSSGDGI